MVFSSTLDSTVYLTTTNEQGSTVTYVPTLVTTTMVYTNSRGEPVTTTKVVSNPTLLPGDRGGGASAFFRNKAAVAGVFAAVGLVIIVTSCLLVWNFRSRHKRKRLAHDNAVAAIIEGRRSTGRLTLIDDDEDDGSYGRASPTEHSGSGHGRVSTRSSSYSYSSSNGRMSPNDSAGQMTSQTPFPPVSLLAASYNRRRSSSSHGHGGSGKGSDGRYQHLRAGSGGPSQTEFGVKIPSPPPLPRFSHDYHRDPFSDLPSVTFLLGTKGDNRSPQPAILGEFEPVPPTLIPPVSPDRSQHDLVAQNRGFGYNNPFSSNTSLNTGDTTPKDLEVRNVFDEELGSVPKIGRKLMLSVQNHP
jgi:hypothetical protein